ncbi:hypothetical protein [Agromyces humi]|uniref:hypothetical protein n=1 Tax=Agromyces humi TaxID=1766800 RepID=UPI0013968298|nr:hypothetical protein [Agromyces humi]
MWVDPALAARILGAAPKDPAGPGNEDEAGAPTSIDPGKVPGFGLVDPPEGWDDNLDGSWANVRQKLGQTPFRTGPKGSLLLATSAIPVGDGISAYLIHSGANSYAMTGVPRLSPDSQLATPGYLAVATNLPVSASAGNVALPVTLGSIARQLGSFARNGLENLLHRAMPGRFGPARGSTGGDAGDHPF